MKTMTGDYEQWKQPGSTPTAGPEPESEPDPEPAELEKAAVIPSGEKFRLDDAVIVHDREAPHNALPLEWHARGRRGHISQLADAHGFTVRFGDLSERRIHASNLWRDHRVGDTVVVHGLRRDVRLNGAKGHVCAALDPGTLRYGVRIQRVVSGAAGASLGARSSCASYATAINPANLWRHAAEPDDEAADELVGRTIRARAASPHEALFDAAREGDAAAVRHLLAQGAEPNAHTDWVSG